MAGGNRGNRFLNTWIFSPLVGVTFGNWLRLMRRHAFHISPRYWSRNAFIAAMSVGNSLIAAYERRHYRGRLAEISVKAPVFVLGHHRSGTTHLWNLLSSNPAFAYPNVLQTVFPHTFLTAEAWMKGIGHRFTPKKRPQDNVEITPESPLEEEFAICTATFLSVKMARHFPRLEERFRRYLSMREATERERARWKAALDTFARKLLLNYGTDKTLLFKAPDHTAKIALIRELYPDARFVHIHREPYRVYKSTWKMEIAAHPYATFQKPDPSKLEDFILWRYREMFDRFVEDSASLPEGQLVEVAFEDLEQDPVGVAGRIYRTLSLPGWERAKPELEAYARSIAGYKKNVYTKLPDDVRARVAEAWGPSFERWDYPRD